MFLKSLLALIVSTISLNAMNQAQPTTPPATLQAIVPYTPSLAEKKREAEKKRTEEAYKESWDTQKRDLKLSPQPTYNRLDDLPPENQRQIMSYLNKEGQYTFQDISEASHDVTVDLLSSEHMLPSNIFDPNLLFTDFMGDDSTLTLDQQLDVLEKLAESSHFGKRLISLNANLTPNIPVAAMMNASQGTSLNKKLRQYYQYLCDILSDAKNLRDFHFDPLNIHTMERLLSVLSKNLTSLDIMLRFNKSRFPAGDSDSKEIEHTLNSFLKFKKLENLTLCIFPHQNVQTNEGEINAKILKFISQNENLKYFNFTWFNEGQLCNSS